MSHSNHDTLGISPTKIVEKYKEIPLSSEKSQLLLDYFNSFVHLYGIFPIKLAWARILQDNPTDFTNEELEKFSIIAREESQSFRILGDEDLYPDRAPSSPENRVLCGRFLLEYPAERLQNLKLNQKSVPYFQPEKDLLLKYKDPYFSGNHQERDTLSCFYTKLAPNQPQLLKKRLETLIKLLKWGETEEETLLAFADSLMLTQDECHEYLPIYQNFVKTLESPDFRGHSKEKGASLCEKQSENSNPPVTLGKNIRKALLEGMMDEAMVRQRISKMNATEEEKQGMYLQLKEILDEKSLSTPI